MPMDLSLDLHSLRRAYDAGLTPTALVRELFRRIRTQSPANAWIHLLDEADVVAAARALEERDPAAPLWGVPFAVKDNIDVASLPTTAACPDFAYTPAQSAEAVERLLAAGALLIGKTNLDQFATGLVGTRSPYGACANAFNPAYISGGSSAGSAVAVAAGLVSFALGTDTAGSGRVPAGFNNIVGLKPSAGLISTKGVVPACRSLDCVSVFALTAADASAVLAAAGTAPAPRVLPAAFRFGVPAVADREFFGDADNGALFERAVERLMALGGTPVEIDFAPLRSVAELLYEGPWVAERYTAIQGFFDADPQRLLPVTRAIIGKGAGIRAADLFRGLYRLAELRDQTEALMASVDLLAVPTAPRIYTIEAVQADPIGLNSHLGYYTNFVNLLGYCALSVPAALRGDGLPFGITLIAPHGHDAALAGLGAHFHAATGLPLGATGAAQPPAALSSPAAKGIRLAVVGAHLSGQPLNHQLTTRGARLVRCCRTAPEYRLYALPGTVPPKPGLARDTQAGRAIEVEVWELTAQAFGEFVAEVPPPLGIGNALLEDGESVKGFICEPYALMGAEDISDFGGWRAYRAARTPTPQPATAHTEAQR